MDWLEILKTRIGYQGATSLADKLTAARAGYLDNINNAQLLNVPNLSTLSAARIGYLDNINQAGLLQVTAARAGYLDNIANAQLLNITAARLGYIDRLTLLAAGGAGELTVARVGYLDNINQAGLLQVTAVRAGNLDNLDATVSSRSSHSAADVRTSVTLVGDPANSIGKALYEIYITRLTAARAGYLDNINNANLSTIPNISTLSAARIGYLDNINQVGLLQVTAARAAYLDNLIGSVTTGTFSLVNNVNEQDALVIAAGTRLVDIELDMINLTQTNTVREYVQVDGATYRQISAKVFPTDFDTNTKAVIISFVQKNSLYKITLQASVLEGVARNVPYRYITRDLV